MSGTERNSRTIMIIAGEVSGDMHGARLVRELRAQDSRLDFFGIGGRFMRDEGVQLVHDVHDLAVLGLVEIVRHYPKIRSIFYHMLNLASQRRPDAVILIDYPGFNVRLAKRLKKLGIPVIYYISPQVWAWGLHRRKVIAQSVDKMLVFFEFEKQFYHDTGLDVEFVGHPLVETVKTQVGIDEYLNVNKLDKKYPIVGLLPGSRKNEIRKILPVMLQSAKEIWEKNKEVQFVLPIGSSVPRDEITAIVDRSHIRDLTGIKLIDGQVHETMAYSHIVLIASGTATLETACFATPMIIIYKVSFLTALLARMVIKIPYIGLVNVVAGTKIVPEFLQKDAKPANIAQCALSYLTDTNRLENKRKELSMIKNKLGAPGAARRAAQSIMIFLDSGK